jgi:hypothetical protein
MSLTVTQSLDAIGHVFGQARGAAAAAVRNKPWSKTQTITPRRNGKAAQAKANDAVAKWVHDHPISIVTTSRLCTQMPFVNRAQCAKALRLLGYTSCTTRLSGEVVRYWRMFKTDNGKE